jgi:hypothetical protein
MRQPLPITPHDEIMVILVCALGAAALLLAIAAVIAYRIGRK